MFKLYEVSDPLSVAQDSSQFMKFLLLGILALFATTGCTVVTENGSETVFPLLGSDDDLYMKAENPVVLP
jgi:hypothetical protein